MIPPHLVAKYRTGNKSDKNDAAAIYEASKNHNIYFVYIRTLEQQDLATQQKWILSHQSTIKSKRCRITNFDVLKIRMKRVKNDISLYWDNS
ncbi:hypothetical protein A3197_17165 [Candidatus Thiodiazotropha endoloripes]|nr:hypothetical protein A3197_17165 [Candidatus Thiodiazotropha endoloripes]